jgi:hypothetical protein
VRTSQDQLCGNRKLTHYQGAALVPPWAQEERKKRKKRKSRSLTPSANSADGFGMTGLWGGSGRDC